MLDTVKNVQSLELGTALVGLKIYPALVDSDIFIFFTHENKEIAG